MLTFILVAFAVLAVIILLFGFNEGEPGAIIGALIFGAGVFGGFAELDDLKTQAEYVETYQSYYEKAMDANKVLTRKLKSQEGLTANYKSQLKTLGDQVDTLQGEVLVANQRADDAQGDLQEAKAKIERIQSLTGALDL